MSAALAAPIISSVVGGLLSRGGGGSTTQTRSTSAQPFTAGGGLFSTSWGKGVQPNLGQSLTPEQQAQLAQLQFLSQQGSNTGFSTTPREDREYGGFTYQNQNTPYQFTSADLAGVDPAVLAAYQQMSGGGSKQNGLNMSIVDPTLQAINAQGLFGAQSMFDQAMNNPNAAMAGDLGGMFMQQLMDQGNSPMALAENQFNLLNPILQNQQNQDYLNLESRLFGQGRLGATSGSNDMNAFFDAGNDATRKLLYDSLGLGMASQAQNASLAGMFSQLDPSLRGQYQQLGSGFLNIPLSLQQAMLNQTQIAGALSGANTVGSLTPPGLNPAGAVGAGLLNSGVQGLTNAIPGLFNSAGQSPWTNNPINGYVSTTAGR